MTGKVPMVGKARRGPSRLAAGGAGALALALGLLACTPAPDRVGATAENLLGQNGLAVNGLAVNGLAVNGLAVNGLAVNGLAVNGMDLDGLALNATPDFLAWWASDPALAAMVMGYVSKCAVAAGAALVLELDDVQHVWPGNLGLAPTWVSGQAIPPAEQQLVSACLAAHANKFGLHVGLSVRGPRADGTLVALDAGEDGSYSRPEGCFFGNIFDGTGVFNGYFSSAWAPAETNPRGCSVEQGLPGVCPPMQNLGSCDALCTPVPGVAATVWADCQANGVHYLPITTYLQPSDVYVCGDGVCQFTESPYDPLTGAGCLADCGSL